MNAVRLLALLIYTCGAFAFGSLIVLSLLEAWTRQPNARDQPVDPRQRELEWVGAALQLVSFVWFVTLALLTLLELRPSRPPWPFYALQLWLACAFPPLIMHITYTEVAADGRVPSGRSWRVPLWVAYAVMHSTAVWSILVFAHALTVPRPFAQRILNTVISCGFIVAAVYATTLMSRNPRQRETVRERQSRRWHLGLFGVVVLLFGFIFVLTRPDSAPAGPVFFGLLEIGAKSLPLPFLFVAAYFEHRFEFFDLFVKRGLALFLTIAVLTGAFALLLPFLSTYQASPLAPWVYAIVLLPIVTALPWLYGRINATLDRRWLGRRFSPVDAVTRFLEGLQSATTEAQLIECAETGLSEIFDARVSVRLDATAEPPDFDVVQEVAIRPGQDSPGRILLGRRGSEAPYFSEDVALLKSLADVLAPVRDNLSLQRREQEQDLRARELSLHASRSELKALRAQINPHFLFNALNAIAGLIHKDPAVADRTIEQLADVFRYALRGGESEWALLDEELEFVRAYLEVERARFGSRLTIDVRLDDEARGARVPTMIVQTLVENAVKHGVALVRGAAAVEVRARKEHGWLVVTVADTGPGFDGPARTGQPWERTGTRRDPRPRSSGYGLANIRQRLEGYFGDAASLAIARDVEHGRTVVSVTLPFELLGTRHVAATGAVKEQQR